MDLRHRLVAAAVTVALGGLAVAGSLATPVAGKKLLIKDNATTSKRKAVWVSKDAGFTPSDPTATGAVVSLLNTSNPDFCTLVQWSLPASNWTAKNGKFKYVDKTLANGPVKSALLKPGLIKVVAKGTAVGFPLLHHGPQGSVGAILFVGGQEACALFPGAQGILKKDDSAKGAFVAVKSEAPSSCPQLPPGCNQPT